MAATILVAFAIAVGAGPAHAATLSTPTPPEFVSWSIGAECVEDDEPAVVTAVVTVHNPDDVPIRFPRPDGQHELYIDNMNGDLLNFVSVEPVGSDNFVYTFARAFEPATYDFMLGFMLSFYVESDDLVVPDCTSPGPVVDRVAGSDRYDVAVHISKLAYPGTADVVFVATGTNYPDALSAGPAAAELGGPLLLTTTGTLLPNVKAEIQRLAPDRIVVVGGVNSIGPAVFDQLKALQIDTVRVGGANRYEVSRNLAQFAFGESGAPTAYLATGVNFPDALSAGPAAASQGGPVVLVYGAAPALDPSTKAMLTGLGVTDVVIAGGPNSVSTGIEAELSTISTVVRDGGADRFAASVNINLRAFPTASRAFLATALKFPDALSGSAWAGAINAPLFVTNTDCVPEATLAALDTEGADHITLLGGNATLTPAVQALTTCAW